MIKQQNMDVNKGTLDELIDECVYEYSVVTFCLQDGVKVGTRRLVPKHISSLEFLDLIPGHAYTITVQSKSGMLTNSNTATGRTGTHWNDWVNWFKFQKTLIIIDCYVSAPACVTALQADNDHTTHSLTISWERPVGVYDGYSLQLLDEAGVVVANRSVSVESRSERVEGLTSGRWYRVKVATLSGSVPSQEATAEGQTRKSLR